jgi:hypothetical protein
MQVGYVPRVLTSFCASRADPKEGQIPVRSSSQYREVVFAQVRSGRSLYEFAEGLEVSGRAARSAWENSLEAIMRGPFLLLGHY